MEKVYCGNGKEVGEYGQIRISIGTNDVQKILARQEENKGWCNILVSRRKDADERGNTHYAYIDTWKATKTKEEAQEQLRDMAQGAKSTPAPVDNVDDVDTSDVPF